MGKFRKKPVVIEAVQFRVGEGLPDGVLYHAACPSSATSTAACSLDGRHYIETLEGNHIVSDGDWIITGVQGEKYPCKPDIFEMTYEPVE